MVTPEHFGFFNSLSEKQFKAEIIIKLITLFQVWILHGQANGMSRTVAISKSIDADVDCLLTMLQQEDGSYSYHQWLPSSSNYALLFGEERLNAKWREKICQWSYNVVDQ
jgi:hypothetical protein